MLYLNFRNTAEVTIIIAALTLAIICGICLMNLEGVTFSVAVGVSIG